MAQSLDQQENMKISGSNARHMVMQKLMRTAEVSQSFVAIYSPPHRRRLLGVLMWCSFQNGDLFGEHWAELSSAACQHALRCRSLCLLSAHGHVKDFLFVRCLIGYLPLSQCLHFDTASVLALAATPPLVMTIYIYIVTRINTINITHFNSFHYH